MRHFPNTTPIKEASEMEKNTPGITVSTYSFVPSPTEQFLTKNTFASEMINGMARRTNEPTVLLPIKCQTSDLHSGLVCRQSASVRIPEIYPVSRTVSAENSYPR